MMTVESNLPSSAPKPTASHFISENTIKWFAIVVALMLGAYLLGFIPNWLSVNSLKAESARLRESLSAYTLKADLATASLHAEQGRFDEAIAAAGPFFEKLNKELGAAVGILNNETANREAAVNMLTRRDEVIAMLARSDPNASAVLAGWYFELETFKHEGK